MTPRKKKPIKQPGYYEDGFMPDLEGALAIPKPPPLTEADWEAINRQDKRRQEEAYQELKAQGAYDKPTRADEILKLARHSASNWNALLDICWGPGVRTQPTHRKPVEVEFEYDPD